MKQITIESENENRPIIVRKGLNSEFHIIQPKCGSLEERNVTISNDTAELLISAIKFVI